MTTFLSKRGIAPEGISFDARLGLFWLEINVGYNVMCRAKEVTDADNTVLLQGAVTNWVLLIWLCAGNDN